MSALVDRALEAAGLQDVLAARRRGAVATEHARQLRDADLLALGALADRVRSEEVGPEVRIYADARHDGGGGALVATFPRGGREDTGLELLREVAIARICGPAAARVRVDWSRAGLELAQIALGFGANELVGRLANKLGLPLAPGELLGTGKKSALLPAEVVKSRELEAFVTRAGRVPVFVRSDASGPGATGTEETIG